MPLFDPGHPAQARTDLERQAHTIIRGVALPVPPFHMPRGSADFMLRALEDEQAAVLLVEEGVEYRGAEGDLSACFLHPAHNGWRPLRVLRAGDAGMALQQANEFLGLAGERPRRAA